MNAPVGLGGRVALGAGAAVIGVGLARWVSPVLTGRMLPWVLGRGLGVAAFCALWAVTLLGVWLRHPWRLRRPGGAWPSPTGQLRIHAALTAVAGMLVIGHVAALALDRYAGVGWVGTFVPFRSDYRPLPVALGTFGLYAGVLVGGTAALAGSLARRAWLPVHRLAAACFALLWAHGVLAGSDTGVLTWLYLGTGGAVLALAVSRRLARDSAVELAGRPGSRPT